MFHFPFAFFTKLPGDYLIYFSYHLVFTKFSLPLVFLLLLFFLLLSLYFLFLCYNLSVFVTYHTFLWWVHRREIKIWKGNTFTLIISNWGKMLIKSHRKVYIVHFQIKNALTLKMIPCKSFSLR